MDGRRSQAWARRINSLVSGWPPVRLIDASDADRGVAFSGSVAESIVRQGLPARFLPELAAANDVNVQSLYEFAGIGRTTVSRRAVRGESLPHGASVKAMQFIQLMAAAVNVFDSSAEAALWLTRAHPLLAGESPLVRARTPWGFDRVQGMVGALQYGTAA